MKKMQITYLISTILFLVLGMVQCWRWSHFGGTVTGGWLLNFLPASILFIAFLITPDIKRKIWHYLLIFICILVIIFWVLMGIGVEVLFSKILPVTDVYQYEEILENRWSQGFMKPFVEHFPKTLPENKKDIQFYFRPAFLQGGSDIQLRVKKDKKNIENLYKIFSEQKLIYSEEDDASNGTSKKNLPTVPFYTNESKNRKFPEDYEIMIFHSRRGNHGENYGVAISKQRSEIVYFAEYW